MDVTIVMNTARNTCRELTPTGLSSSGPGFLRASVVIACLQPIYSVGRTEDGVKMTGRLQICNGRWGGSTSANCKGLTQQEFTLSQAVETGRCTVKQDPFPSALRTSIEPWWASTIHFAIASPNPLPPFARERASSTL